MEAKQAEILIVDDTRHNLTVLSQVLEQAGYKVRVAIDGKSALMSVEFSTPNLVLLDIKMPEMDGFEVLERFRQLESMKHVPVIFISALNDLETKLQAFHSGGIDYIDKPFRIQEVLARVQTHLTIYFQRLEIEHLRQLEHKKLEIIQRSEERYRDLFDNAQLLIQSVDAQGHFIYVNRYWQEVLGYTPEEVDRLTLMDIVHPDHIVECQAMLEKLQEDTSLVVQAFEVRFVSKTGNNVQLEGNINSQWDDIWGWYTRGIFQNITQRRQAENQARQLMIEHERMRVLANFVEDTSHDLRTPLTYINQHAHLIRYIENKTDREVRVQLIEKEVSHISQTLDQFYELANLHYSSQLNIEPIYIRDIIDNPT